MLKHNFTTAQVAILRKQFEDNAKAHGLCSPVSFDRGVDGNYTHGTMFYRFEGYLLASHRLVGDLEPEREVPAPQHPTFGIKLEGGFTTVADPKPDMRKATTYKLVKDLKVGDVLVMRTGRRTPITNLKVVGTESQFAGISVCWNNGEHEHSPYASVCVVAA